MNSIYIGTPHLDPPKGGYLFIHDNVPLLPRAAYFDPTRDSFNILQDLTYRKACDIVDAFQALFCVTSGTLTESTGLDCIAEALDHIGHAGKMVSLETLLAPPDKTSTTGEVWAYSKVRRLLRSPVLRQVLCNPKPNFGRVRAKTVLMRLNRAEIGDFDCRAIALFGIALWEKQVVLPDLGFYGRETHVSLIREERLIGGCYSLDELPVVLRRAALRVPDKFARGCLYEDATLLAKHRGMIPGTIEFNDAVSEMMTPPEPREQAEFWMPPPLKEKKVQTKKPRTRTFRRL